MWKFSSFVMLYLLLMLRCRDTSMMKKNIFVGRFDNVASTPRAFLIMNTQKIVEIFMKSGKVTANTHKHSFLWTFIHTNVHPLHYLIFQIPTLYSRRKCVLREQWVPVNLREEALFPPRVAPKLLSNSTQNMCKQIFRKSKRFIFYYHFPYIFGSIQMKISSGLFAFLFLYSYIPSNLRRYRKLLSTAVWKLQNSNINV